MAILLTVPLAIVVVLLLQHIARLTRAKDRICPVGKDAYHTGVRTVMVTRQDDDDLCATDVATGEEWYRDNHYVEGPIDLLALFEHLEAEKRATKALSARITLKQNLDTHTRVERDLDLLDAQEEINQLLRAS